MNHRRVRLLWLVMFLLLASVPFRLTYREVQRAKASVALIAAIKRHDTPAALAALDAGADPNVKEGERAPSFSQVLYNWWKQICKNITGMTILLEHGADVNARENDGETALMAAAVCEPSNNLQILLKHGADVNARNRHGSTALMAAIGFEQVEKVKALLNAGADVRFKDASGETALKLAIQERQLKIVVLLKQAGATK